MIERTMKYLTLLAVALCVGAAPATKPATNTELTRQIDELRQRLADLEKQVRELQDHNAAATKAGKPVGPKVAATQEKQQEWFARHSTPNKSKPLKIGMTLEEVKAAVGYKESRITYEADGFQMIEWGFYVPLIDGTRSFHERVKTAFRNGKVEQIFHHEDDN